MEKNKEDKQTLEELNSAHHRSQAKCQLDLGRAYRPHCIHSVLTTSVKILSCTDLLLG